MPRRVVLFPLLTLFATSVLVMVDIMDVSCGLQLLHHGLKVLPTANSIFSPQEATVIEQSPRSLMVSCKICGCSILFASLHAPHEQSDQDAKDVWWKYIESYLRKASGHSLLCLMGDYNARVGEEDGNLIGERTCSITNDNGMRMYTFMQDLGLWAPSTFGSVHSGHDWTWTHPKGTKARLDYILVSQDERLVPWSSRVLDEIQSSLTTQDHEAVLQEIQVAVYEKCKRIKRRAYDWELLHTEWGTDRLREIISNLPSPSWEEDVHTHWQQLEDGIHQGLKESFPPRPRPRRRDIFSKETWGHVARRKACKFGLEQCDLALDFLDVSFAWKAWKDGALIGDAARAGLLSQWLTVLAHGFFKKGFKQHAVRVRQSVQTDKAQYIEQVVIRMPTLLVPRPCLRLYVPFALGGLWQREESILCRDFAVMLKSLLILLEVIKFGWSIVPLWRQEFVPPPKGFFKGHAGMWLSDNKTVPRWTWWNSLL